jgi:hypothetical protein
MKTGEHASVENMFSFSKVAPRSPAIDGQNQVSRAAEHAAARVKVTAASGYTRLTQSPSKASRRTVDSTKSAAAGCKLADAKASFLSVTVVEEENQMKCTGPHVHELEQTARKMTKTEVTMLAKSITREQVENLFHMKLNDAAARVGV